MSTDKTQMRREILHDVGCDAEDLAESCRRQSHEFRGAKAALRRSAQSLKTVAARVDKDLDGGTLAIYGDGAQNVAKYAKLQVQRCMDSIENAALHAENCETSANGGIMASEKMIARLKKKLDATEAKLKSIEDAIAAGDVIPMGGELVARDGLKNRDRPAGVRPAPSVAEQRKAEAKSEKPKRKTRKKKETNGADTGQNAGA